MNAYNSKKKKKHVSVSKKILIWDQIKERRGKVVTKTEMYLKEPPSSYRIIKG